MRFLILAALCSTACAHSSFIAPSRGGPSWHELRSAHFILRTNLGESVARARMAELETYRAALLTAWPALHPPARVVVFAPATAAEMDEFSFDRQQRELGFYYRDWFGDPTVVIGGDHAWTREPSLARLLGLEILNVNLRRAPLWLRVGLAAWLEMVRVDQGRPVVGAPHPLYAGDLLRVGPVPVEWVRSWTPRSSPRHLVANTSWLLVHHLMVTRQDELRNWLQRLAAGEAPSSAWTESFGGLSNEVLDRELKTKAARGTLDVETLPALDAKAEQIEVRGLGEAELRALRAEVRAYSPVNYGLGAVTDEGRAGLELDPANARAIVFASASKKEHAERARAAIAAHPDDWRTQVVLWSARFQLVSDKSPHVAPPLWYLDALYWLRPVSDPEMDAAAERAAQLAPDNATVLGIVAASRLGRKRYPEALSAAEAILRTMPGAIGPLMLLADALAGTDRCDEAGQAVRLAASRLDEVEQAQGPIFYGHIFSTGQADLEEALRQRLARYSAPCTPVSR